MDENNVHDEIFKEDKIIFKKYKLKNKIGKGAFGQVYRGICLENNELVAIKIEPRKIEKPYLESEAFFLYSLKGPGIPEVLSFGRLKHYNVLIEQLLDKSLFDIFNERRKKLSLEDICLIAIQIIDRIQWVHSKNIVYRDIKPDNFLIGRKDPNIIYLIDFGLSKKYKSSSTGKHIKFSFTGRLTGTVRFASANALRGGEQSRRDDLESIGYMIIFFMRGKLPWQGVIGLKKIERYLKIYKMKKSVKPEELCKSLPSEMVEYMKYVKSLEFDQDPNYNFLRNIFKSILKTTNKSNDQLIFSWLRLSDLPNLKNPINPSTRKDSLQSRLYRKIQKKLIDQHKRNKSQDNDSGQNSFQTCIITMNTELGNKSNNKNNNYSVKKLKSTEDGLNTLIANLNKTLDLNIIEDFVKDSINNCQPNNNRLRTNISEKKIKINNSVIEIINYKKKKKIKEKLKDSTLSSSKTKPKIYGKNETEIKKDKIKSIKEDDNFLKNDDENLMNKYKNIIKGNNNDDNNDNDNDNDIYNFNTMKNENYNININYLNNNNLNNNENIFLYKSINENEYNNYNINNIYKDNDNKEIINNNKEKNLTNNNFYNNNEISQIKKKNNYKILEYNNISTNNENYNIYKDKEIKFKTLENKKYIRLKKNINDKNNYNQIINEDIHRQNSNNKYDYITKNENNNMIDINNHIYSKNKEIIQKEFINYIEKENTSDNNCRRKIPKINNQLRNKTIINNTEKKHSEHFKNLNDNKNKNININISLNNMNNHKIKIKQLINKKILNRNKKIINFNNEESITNIEFSKINDRNNNQQKNLEMIPKNWDTVDSNMNKVNINNKMRNMFNKKSINKDIIKGIFNNQNLNNITSIKGKKHNSNSHSLSNNRTNSNYKNSQKNQNDKNKTLPNFNFYRNNNDLDIHKNNIDTKEFNLNPKVEKLIINKKKIMKNNNYNGKQNNKNKRISININNINNMNIIPNDSDNIDFIISLKKNKIKKITNDNEIYNNMSNYKTTIDMNINNYIKNSINNNVKSNSKNDYEEINPSNFILNKRLSHKNNINSSKNIYKNKLNKTASFNFKNNYPISYITPIEINKIPSYNNFNVSNFPNINNNNNNIPNVGGYDKIKKLNNKKKNIFNMHIQIDNINKDKRNIDKQNQLNSNNGFYQYKTFWEKQIIKNKLNKINLQNSNNDLYIKNAQYKSPLNWEVKFNYTIQKNRITPNKLYNLTEDNNQKNRYILTEPKQCLLQDQISQFSNNTNYYNYTIFQNQLNNFNLNSNNSNAALYSVF